MRKYIIYALVLAAAAATCAQAKNWAKDLDNKDEAKRERAARELMGKAIERGLTGEEIEALAEATDDPALEVQRHAINALASNTKIATSQEYAPYYANRGHNFVAFLLWYSVYNTYSQIKAITRAGPTGDTDEEMAYAKKEAERAFENMFDPERKSWAQRYYDELKR